MLKAPPIGHEVTIMARETTRYMQLKGQGYATVWSGEGKIHMKKVERLDFTRTKAAIEAYDKYDDSFRVEDWSDLTLEQIEEGFLKLEELGRAVGEAFGLDTADRNNVETCKAMIRPGHKVPGPGCELSFVRRMVAEYE